MADLDLWLLIVVFFFGAATLLYLWNKVWNHVDRIRDRDRDRRMNEGWAARNQKLRRHF